MKTKATTIAILVFFLVATAWAQELEIFKPKFRTGEDLLAAMQAAVGADGTVTLDARTGSLVVSGTPTAIARAKKVLAELDVKPRTVRIELRWLNESALRNMNVGVDWSIANGQWRIGRFKRTQGPGAEQMQTDAGGSVNVYRSTDAVRQSIRVLEGDFAMIASGQVREFSPSVIGWSGFEGPQIAGRLRRVQNGLLARPRIVGDDVQLDLVPQAVLYTADDRREQRYFEAQTTVRIPNGGQILLAVDNSQGDTLVVETFRGLTVRQSSGSTQSLMLIEVFVEE